MGNKINENLKIVISKHFILNIIISVIYGAKFLKCDTHVVGGHLEGTRSQIFYLGPSFMISRTKCFPFIDIT